MSFSEEVTGLVESFVLAIHEAARLELLEEMRAFAAARQKREPRLRRAPRRKKRRAARVRVVERTGPAIPLARISPEAVLGKPPRLSAEGHTRGCRRGSTGKCSPNCVPTSPAPASDEEAKEEESAPVDSFTTRDIREAVEVARANDATVHGPSCAKPDGDCAPSCFVPIPIEPGSVLAEEKPDRRPAAKPRRYSPEEIAAKGQRVVVVRIDGKPPRTALWVGSPKEGFHDVQLAQGGNHRFAGRRHRILDVELVRDATPQEASRGYVV